jgi:hypothetical protein
MNHKLDIETRLDRSLQNQLKVPRLDGRFDAGVWARIAAQEQGATNPVQQRVKAPSSARWLFVINVVGVAVAALLVVIFGTQAFADVSVSLPKPEISAVTGDQIIKVASQVITLVALVFGLLFTPIGRRLRAELT